jgi:hypothetical protein
VIANSSLDADFQPYQRAILYYADRLDVRWGKYRRGEPVCSPLRFLPDS